MLEINHLHKTFHPGTINENHAVNNFSLNFQKGDYVAVIGGNGAGKSTILNMISGAILPDSGSIVLGGKDITHMSEHKRASLIGRVFQDPMMGSAADMLIEENLAMALRRGEHRGLRWGISREERAFYRQKLEELGLGLENRLSVKMGLLSGGQRQAITLLMATIKQPQLLLLDEHTAALDPKTAANVMNLSNRIITEQNLTTLMVTHNMKDAIAYGNRLIMLNKGKVVLDISGIEKSQLTVKELVDMFSSVSGDDLADDSLLLA